MTHDRAFYAVLVCAAAMSVSGCVAAAAIPVLAGGAVVRTSTDGVDADTALMREPITRPSPTPEPVLSQIDPAQVPGPAKSQPHSRLFSYVRKWDGQRSATLQEPSALDGARNQCASETSAVLIDLDPAAAAYAPGAPLSVPGYMAANLAEWRARGIGVAWITKASAAYAGDVRVALKQSGLDPTARDALLMMRYPTDRKQTRREDFAATTCLIAIAGDERADFEELYEHLINPEAAYGLERLMNNGWFLIPSLVRSAPTTATLASKHESNE
ncbi:MAG: hypothetical protein AAGH57_01480 [Pseudomonadota bacterium]